MSTPEKRRPSSGSGGGSNETPLRTPAVAAASSSSGAKRNSMPAPPPRAQMAAMGVGSADEPLESGGVSLTADGRKDKDSVAGSGPGSVTSGGGGPGNSRSGSVKETDRDKDRRERRDKKDRRERELQQLQLRERDERIAHLEREMGIMEREFHRELDKLSQNESETATFWQAKHSALNQQYLRTDTELRLLRAEVDVREGERQELREGWEVLRRELKDRDEEIRRLRGQVRGLKEWVSTSTRTDGQTSDEVFGDGMTRLGNGLQNWVIVNFRKAKLNVANLDEETLAELSELVPTYEDLVQTAKVHLLQSIVSRILVDMVFGAYFFGLSKEQTGQFREMEKLLSSLAPSDEPVNQWRSSTLSLFRRETTPSQLAESTEACTEAVLVRIARLLDALAGTTPSDARESALRVLVNNSVELARLLVVQKAAFRVYMPEILPHQQVMFDANTMEDLGGEDEEALDAREICCVAFPGIIKHGDENGGHLQYRNVIAKARVLCSPDQ